MDKRLELIQPPKFCPICGDKDTGWAKKVFQDEWGYFSLDELEGLRLPYGLKIERDLYFGEKKISEIRR